MADGVTYQTGTLATPPNTTPWATVELANSEGHALRVVDGGANTATTTSVGDDITSQTILAANTDRIGATLWNDSTAIAYVHFGAIPSLSLAQYAEVSNWFAAATGNGTTRSVTGLNWSAGDTIVVFCAGGSGFSSTGQPISSLVPTNANLSFSSQGSVGFGASESSLSVYVATAASAQTSQTIAETLTIGGTTTGNLVFGAAVYVISGQPTGTANFTINLTETAPSITTQAGSIVLFTLVNFLSTTPTKTPLTGSGTPTERLDTGDGVNYGLWIADWVGTTAGTASYGPNNYTSLQVSQAIIEITRTAIPFHVAMQPNSMLEVPFMYRGRIDAYWASNASGAMRVAEMT